MSLSATSSVRNSMRTDIVTFSIIKKSDQIIIFTLLILATTGAQIRDVLRIMMVVLTKNNS